MSLVKLLWIGALAAAGCKQESKAASAPQASAPAVAPGAGPPAQLHYDQRVAWEVGGRRIEAVLFTVKDTRMVRVLDGGKSIDVHALDPGDEYSLRVVNGAVVAKSSSIVGRRPEVGAISAYDAVQLGWSTAADAPVVLQTWSCDEQARGKECIEPAWMSDGKPAPAPGLMELNDEVAIATARAFLASAIARDEKAVAMLVDESVTIEDETLSQPVTGCENDDAPMKRAAAARCAVSLFSGGDKKHVKRLKIEPTSATTLPAPNGARLVRSVVVPKNFSPPGAQSVSIVVALVDGVPRVVAAQLFVDSDH